MLSAVVRPKVPGQGTKIGAFSQLYINFEHEKRCTKKCFMMEGKQKQVRQVTTECVAKSVFRIQIQGSSGSGIRIRGLKKM